MSMRHAILYSITVYFATFILGILGLVIFGYGPDLSSVPTIVYLYGIATSILIMMIFTKIYFKKSRVKPDITQGAYFGLTVIAVGFVIDFCIAILPALLSQTGPDIMAYYSNPLFWVNVAVIPITSAITGSYLEKSAKNQPKASTSKTSKIKKKTSKKS